MSNLSWKLRNLIRRFQAKSMTRPVSFNSRFSRTAQTSSGQRLRSALATLLAIFTSTNAMAQTAPATRTPTMSLTRGFQVASCGTERLHPPMQSGATAEYARMREAYEKIFTSTNVGRAICHRMAPSTDVMRLTGVSSDRLRAQQRECETRDVSGETWIRLDTPAREPIANTCGESYNAMSTPLPRNLSSQQLREFVRQMSRPEVAGQYDMPRTIDFVRAPRGHVVESWSAGRNLTIFVPPEGLTEEAAIRIAAHELAVHLDAKADYEYGISMDASLRANDPERARQVLSSHPLLGPAFAAIRAYRVEERILQQANPQARDERSLRLRRMISQIRDEASCREVVGQMAEMLAPSTRIFQNGSQTCEALSADQARQEAARAREALRGLDGLHFQQERTDESIGAAGGRGQDACLFLVEPELTNANRSRSDGPSPGTGRLPP